MSVKPMDRLRKITVAGAMGSAALLGAHASVRAAGDSSRVAQGKCANINALTVTNVLNPGSSVLWSCISAGNMASSNASSGTALNVTASTASRAQAIARAAVSGAPSFSLNSSSGLTALSKPFVGYGGLFVDVGNGARGYNDPDGTLDQTGTTLTGSPMSMPGSSVEITAQFHAFTDQRLMRIAYTFSNQSILTKGLAPVNVNAWIGGRLGFDNLTQLENSSNGDNTLDATDNWLVTSDGTAAIPTLKIVHVPYGAGADVIPVNTQAPVGGNDRIGYRYQFSLAANESKTLVWFVGLGITLDEANTLAAQFNTMDPNLFNNLPTGSPVVNWPSAPIVAGPATPVPLNNPLGLFALAGLLGFIGWRRLRVRVEG